MKLTQHFICLVFCLLIVLSHGIWRLMDDGDPCTCEAGETCSAARMDLVTSDAAIRSALDNICGEGGCSEGEGCSETSEGRHSVYPGLTTHNDACSYRQAGIGPYADCDYSISTWKKICCCYTSDSVEECPLTASDCESGQFWYC